MTIEQLYELYKQFPSVQTDTRKLKAGDIFFALKGENQLRFFLTTRIVKKHEDSTLVAEL